MTPRLVRIKYIKHGMPHGLLCLRATDVEGREPFEAGYQLAHEFLGHETVLARGMGYYGGVVVLWRMLKEEERTSNADWLAMVARLETEARTLKRQARPRFIESRLEHARADARLNRLRWASELQAVEHELARSGWPAPPLDVA